MASHNHHHHHNENDYHHLHHNLRETIPLIPTHYATSPPCCCIQSNQPSPPNLDHLLLLLTSYLQTQQQKESHCSCQTQSPRFNAVVNKKKTTGQREYDILLRKINDLEHSLNHFALSHGDKNTRFGRACDSLKDTAARVIQTHFRSYLVFRSNSLRQLKELAMIKSSYFSLKASVSNKTYFPYEAVCREATDLLLQVDSIQGRIDPMIRDGKRTLSRDLVRFLHYVDDCALKRRDFICKSAKVVSFKGFVAAKPKRSVGEERTVQKLKKQMGRIYVTSDCDTENNAELEEFLFMSDNGQVSVGSSKSRVGALGPVTKANKVGKNRVAYEKTTSEEDDSDSRSRGRGVVVVAKGNEGKTRVMKTVRFDEDGNVYKVYGDTPETSVSEGDESSTTGSNNEVEDLKYVPKENEGFEEDEETRSENEEESSSEGSKEEVKNVSHMGRSEPKPEIQNRKGNSMFSPPLPLKMEP